MKLIIRKITDRGNRWKNSQTMIILRDECCSWPPERRQGRHDRN